MSRCLSATVASLPPELSSILYYLKGGVDHFFFGGKKIVFASLCSFICLQAVYKLSGAGVQVYLEKLLLYSASYIHFTLCD